MAENDPDDGWKVVTSKKRKPSMAKGDQAAASNMSSESGPKASASSMSGFKSLTSPASTSKGRATRSRAKSKRHNKSSGNKPKDEDTSASELLPTSESTTSAQEASIASPETVFQPEMPDKQPTLIAASGGHISPTRSKSSTESVSYVTAQQSQAPETSSSSSESYDSAEEGGVSLDPSLYIPALSLWTPTPQREYSSLTPQASLWTKPSSNSEVPTTAPKPSLWQPSKSEDLMATPTVSLWTGSQGSDPKSHGMGQVQVFAKETEQKKTTTIKEKNIELRTTDPRTNKASTSDGEGNKSTQTFSQEHEIAKLEEDSPQSSSEKIIPNLISKLTVLPAASGQGSFSPISTDVSDVLDGPQQTVAIYQSELVLKVSTISSHQEEAVVKEDDNLIGEHTRDVVINDDMESLGNTAGKDTARKNSQLSSTPSATSIDNGSLSSSSTDHDFGLLSGPSTSADLHTTSNPSKIITPESSAPSSSIYHDSRRIPTFSLSISSTPPLTTTHEDPGPSSSLDHRELGGVSASPAPINQRSSTQAEHSASIVSITTPKMSSGSEEMESGSTSVKPEMGDDETTPRPKFAQLASISEQATSPTRPLPPTLSPIHEESSEFANFRRATIPAEGLDPSSVETLTREQAAVIRPRLNANEQALTGLDILEATSSSGPSPTRASTSRVAQPPPRRASVQPRRSHAIPIRAPLPAPGFARQPPVVQEYDHGLRGVPSHYIPMHGPMHGMFFDPVTNMFVGDGPPRATPERSDGSLPGTSRAQLAAEPISNRPVDPEDALHVQTRGQIASINAAGARAAAVPLLRLPVGVAPTSAPTRAFQRYFCRCTGQWRDRPHNCPEPAPTPFPSAAPIMPGTVLGPEWMTRRLVVDASIYPGGLVPAPGSAAAAETSAVGGGAGDMPARWFGPVPAGTTVGGEPTAVGGTSAGVGGAGGTGEAGEGLAGEAPKKKNKKRRKKKGGAVTTEEGEGKGKGPQEGGGEEGGEGGSGEGVAAV